MNPRVGAKLRARTSAPAAKLSATFAVKFAAKFVARFVAKLAAASAANVAAVLAVGASACAPACAPPPAQVITVAPRPTPEPGPACTPPPVEALAYLADTTCPWVLVPGDMSQLSLRRTDLVAAPALSVAPPEECAGRCRFSGAVTSLGPLLLAVRAGPNSELADAVFIGAALGGRTLRFAPLWYGRPVLGDSTPQGPAYALAPWVCDGMLVLRPGSRLPGAASEEPSAALREAAGVYEVVEDELRRADRPVPEDTKQCTRVPLELP